MRSFHDDALPAALSAALVRHVRVQVGAQHHHFMVSGATGDFSNDIDPRCQAHKFGVDAISRITGTSLLRAGECDCSVPA
jgi:hypothetical protein